LSTVRSILSTAAASPNRFSSCLSVRNCSGKPRPMY
jgi:hypothetical protein